MFSSVCSADHIVLYWDLPETYEKGNKYLIFIDGKLLAETEQCHYKAEGLSPSTAYLFEVVMQGKSEVPVGSATFSTEAVRKRIDITKAPYNAVGDGKTLNTAAIQKAIDDCGEGECVYIPAGNFMTGSLFLHSHMELYIEKDAILHGTCNVEDYSPKIKSRFEGHEMMCYASVLNVGELDREKGFTCRDVRIMGEGTVCSGGQQLKENVIAVEMVLMKDYMDSLGEKIKECETSWTIPGRARPRLINISCAQNVVVAGITIKDSAAWNLHMIYSDSIVTYGCTFRSMGVNNGDGWDPDSSTNCTLFGCEFFTGDDAVAIKSGKNPEGNQIGRPSEHIRIFDCVSHFGHGITIGSEMSGGVRDVRIWNCDMRASVYGVEIKGTKKRGGYVRDVHVSHCNLCRVLMHSVGYNDDGEGAPEAPIFADCTFEDLKLSARYFSDTEEEVSCTAIELAGFDTPGHFLENVKFKNIVIGNDSDSRPQTISLQCCNGVSFENISCR